MRNFIFYTILCAFLFMQNPLNAQRDFSKVEIKTEKISDNIYMLVGSGGNIGVVVGDKKVLMIDSQFAPLSDKISKAIAGISDKPIEMLVNTHWHGDHTGGNKNFGEKGITIVAHENVRERMSTEQIRPFRKPTPAAPKPAIPTITFKEDITLYVGDETLMAFHVHQAHTDGDAIIYFPKSNVMHMGDTYFKGRYPYIDLGSGGSVMGVLKALNKAIFLADSDTKIIPGHGTLSNKKELMEYRDVITTVIDRVKKAIASDMTLEEIKASNLTKEYDEEWGSGFINPDKFMEILYSDLTKEETTKEEKK